MAIVIDVRRPGIDTACRKWVGPNDSLCLVAPGVAVRVSWRCRRRWRDCLSGSWGRGWRRRCAGCRRWGGRSRSRRWCANDCEIKDVDVAAVDSRVDIFPRRADGGLDPAIAGEVAHRQALTEVSFRLRVGRLKHGY